MFQKADIICDDGTVTSHFEDDDLFADLDQQATEDEEIEALVDRLVMADKRNVLLMNTLKVIMILTFVLM